MRATCTGKESVEIKDSDTIMERMAKLQLIAMGLEVTLGQDRTGSNIREF